jgi:DNA repair protein RadC
MEYEYTNSADDYEAAKSPRGAIAISDTPETSNLEITKNCLPAHEMPRERLVNFGAASLKTSELLAILLRTGTAKMPVLELADHILGHVGYNLDTLAKMDSKSMMHIFNGIGEAKALGLVAALELGKRRQLSQREDNRMILNSSHAIFQLISHELYDLSHEEFWVLFLNRQNKMISKDRISQGGYTATIVDLRVIFKMALLEKATSIVLVHNHPSGQNKPSQEDINITRKIVDAGKILNIPVLDHLIISGRTSYFSFSDDGIL